MGLVKVARFSRNARYHRSAQTGVGLTIKTLTVYSGEDLFSPKEALSKLRWVTIFGQERRFVIQIKKKS
jgi:hypothetical protein